MYAKELLAWNLSCVTALHITIETIVHAVKVNFHCMLFGKIFEKERIFEEGLVPLCWVYLFTACCMVLLGCYLSYNKVKYPAYNWTHSVRLKRYWKMLLVYLFVLNILFSKGFHSLCNSLDSAPVYIEWKYFVPKYLDAAQFYPMLMRIMLSSWLNLLCLSYGFYLNTLKQKHDTHYGIQYKNEFAN